MKEFEKVFNRRIERTIKLSISMNNPGGMSKKEIAKLAWKEALELVLSKRRLIPSRFGPVNLIDNNIDCSFIKQELGDEN